MQIESANRNYSKFLKSQVPVGLRKGEQGKKQSVMCHLTQGLFPLEGRREREEKWVNERQARESRVRCVSSSKRRSYGSWLSGQRGELLKTNSRLNSGCDAALEATFLSLDCHLSGGEKPSPNHSRAEQCRAMKYRPLVRHTLEEKSQPNVGLRALWEMDLIFAQAVELEIKVKSF